ncbi:hypothetical protein AK812_SmicGene5137 [Symbiodinium microadriaticum]|uniref:Uncharacterized protein n=1 Tax=Symbiodinium microadriaticum TaxID=2951 RepID=A0A1Q9EUJ5_SYMMI|nr:hypothetical protein AK812_SmicGene5137 [Symbiodinium microadriaticum]
MEDNQSRLQKRLDSLIPTLNLLLRRTLLRDSCVQQVAKLVNPDLRCSDASDKLHASRPMALLKDLEVERCCPEKMSPSHAGEPM